LKLRKKGTTKWMSAIDSAQGKTARNAGNLAQVGQKLKGPPPSREKNERPKGGNHETKAPFGSRAGKGERKPRKDMPYTRKMNQLFHLRRSERKRT